MPSIPKTEIHLNVYDLVDNNNLYVYGLGIYHSGLQIGGTEYTFGREGAFEHEPQKAPAVPLRDSIFLATIELPRDRIVSIVDEVSKEFNTQKYHLLNRNCNHYAKALYERIIDRCGRIAKEKSTPIPGYVNRMAWLGSKFRCLIPPDIINTAVPSSAEGTETADEASSTGAGSKFSAFQGSGRSLSAREEPKKSSSGGLFNSMFSKDQSQDIEIPAYYEDSAESRRERMLKAAEKRMSSKTD